MFYSFYPQENSLLWKLGISWHIHYNKSLDYSYPVYTSVSWSKTDRYYERKYKKYISKNPDCSIDTRLEIIGTHLFKQEEEDKIRGIMKRYHIQDENILFIQWKAKNKAYVQVILPKEARIKTSRNQEQTQYKNFQKVSFFTEADRLQKIVDTIEYSLPNETCAPYNFILYKQPWILHYDILVEDDWIWEDFYWVWGDFHYNTNTQ